MLSETYTEIIKKYIGKVDQVLLNRMKLCFKSPPPPIFIACWVYQVVLVNLREINLFSVVFNVIVLIKSIFQYLMCCCCSAVNEYYKHILEYVLLN